MPTQKTIVRRTDDKVVWLRIDRPHVRNALDHDSTSQLLDYVVEAADDPAVAAVVFTGTGPTFCAGGDLKEIAESDTAGQRFITPMRGSMRNLFEAILETYKPTIAVLNGDAYGAGAELALACDLRFAAEHARFSVPEARRGTGANFASVMLPRLLPPGIAMELLYGSGELSSHEAKALGLFNRVVPAANLPDVVEEYLMKIRSAAPLTLRRCKETVVKASGTPIAAALRLSVGPDAYGSEDRIEGVRSFIEKRAPEFRGR